MPPCGFTRIHGLDAARLQGAPPFPAVWEEISHILEDAPCIVAHNAAFDRSVLWSCLDLYEIHEFRCTLRMARRLLPELGNHQLSTLCHHLGIELQHHEALSYARAAARIVLGLHLKPDSPFLGFVRAKAYLGPEER